MLIQTLPYIVVCIVNVVPGLAPRIFDVYTDTNPAYDAANFYVSHNRPDQRMSDRRLVHIITRGEALLIDKHGVNDRGHKVFTPDAVASAGAMSGSVAYQLPALSAGSHSLRLRVWDTAGNYAEETVDVNVVLLIDKHGVNDRGHKVIGRRLIETEHIQIAAQTRSITRVTGLRLWAIQPCVRCYRPEMSFWSLSTARLSRPTRRSP